MAGNMISGVLTPEQIAMFNEGLALIEQAIGDVVVGLEADDRRSFGVMGERTRSFAQFGLMVAQTYRSIFPPHVQVDEFGRDMALHQSALDMHRRMLPVVEKLADTATLAGYDAYQHALEVYTYAKAAKAEAGLKGLLEQMGSLFKKSRRQKGTDPGSAG